MKLGSHAPQAWTPSRLRFVASIRNSNVDKKSYDGQQRVLLCNYTDVYYNEKITSSDGLMEATASPSEFEKFSLLAGDVIITKDSETANDIGIPAWVPKDLPGVVCGYHLTQLRSNANVLPEFLFRTMQAATTRQYLEVETPGVTRFGLDQDTIGSIPVLVPPINDQHRIISYLNRATTRIDALVAKKTRFIELLREKRQALITHAVTRGLDASVPMKDSGADWLGKVPADWKVVALKRLGKLKGGSGFPPSLQARPYNAIPFFKVGDLGKSADGQHITDTENTITRDEAASLGATIFPAGALAWAKIGAALSLNRRRIIARPCCLDNNMTGFIPDTAIVSTRFAFYLMSAVDFTVHAKPGAVPSFSEGDQGRLLITLPPATSQHDIALHLDGATSRIDTLISKTERSLELLREHRTALITAAVTGKIDIKEAA